MRRRITALAALCCPLLLAAPSFAAKKDAADRQGHIWPAKSGSYYYYLASQLKGFDQDEKSAYTYLSEALKGDAESGFLWGQKAYFEARLGNIDQAFRDANASLAKDPHNVDTLLLVGKLLAVQQKFPQAIVYYRKALALAPKNEEIYNLLARDLIAVGDKNGALASLGRCQRELPEAASCLYYTGMIHMEAGRLDLALKVFNTIIEYNPEQSKILNIVGEIYLKKEQYGKALETFRQLSQVSPHDLSSQIRVGLLYYQMKDLDNAIREFRRIGKRFPKADKVNYFLGLMLLEKGRAEAAYAYFDRIGADSPLFKESFNRQVTILRQTDGLEKAAGLMDEKFKDKKGSEYYQLKASLQLMAETPGDALETLNKGLKKFKNDERMLFQRAVANEKINRWDRAREDLETIIGLNPNAADAYNYLGYSMAEHGEDLSTALGYVEKAVKLKPEEGHILDSLGWIYFKMNQPARALPLLLKAARLEPSEPTILEHLGDVYFSLKDRRRAREYYQKALKILSALAKPTAEEARQTRDIRQKLAEA